MKLSTKYLKITVNIISVLTVVALCIFVLPKLIVFFMPFVIAAVIALIANPLVKFLERKVKIVRKAGTAFVIVAVISLIVLISYFVIAKLIEEIIDFSAKLPEIITRTGETLKSFSGEYNRLYNNMPQSVKDALGNVSFNAGSNMHEWIGGFGTSAAENAAGLAQNIPLILVGIIMGVLASYFFLADKDYIVRIIQWMFPAQMIDRWNLVYGTMKTAVGGYFKAQLKIMGVVYVILLIGFLVLRQPNALLIALLVALLDFLPFFGTGSVMVPWAIIAFLQANYKFCIGVLIIWGISQLVRQIIQPKLLGDSIGLEPIPTIVFLYVGFRVGGAIGLILAVPLGMIVINLYKAGVFSNFVYSIQILSKDMSKWRKFSKEELVSEGIINEDEEI